MESPTRALSQLTYSSEFSVTKDFLDMVAMKTIEQFKEGNLVHFWLINNNILCSILLMLLTILIKILMFLFLFLLLGIILSGIWNYQTYNR